MATAVEKLFSRKAGRTVHAGEIVVVEVDACMAHDVNGPSTVRNFGEIADKVKSPEKCMIVLDHFAPCPNTNIATQHKQLREFARAQGIHLADVCKGTCHQVMLESGKLYPGCIAVATDSHTCSYGALNMFSTGVGAAEAAIAFASDQCWFRVPESVRVELCGKPQVKLSGKDIALELLRVLGPGGANYMCLEFGGDALEHISFDSRVTVCNMAAELGAKGAIMPFDSVTAAWMKEHGISGGEPVAADNDAVYAKRVSIDVSRLEPMVSLPGEICDAVPVSSLEKVWVDQVFIGTCTNGRYEDIALAAELMKGRRIHPGVRLLVIPASAQVGERLRREGLLDVLTEAGASVFPSSCGPCAGLHMGLLGDGEVALSTSNRNSPGRMGSKSAKIYISSPYVAACTAINGYICDRRDPE